MLPEGVAQASLPSTIDALAVALLGVVLVSVAVRHLDVAIWLIAAQGLLLGVTATAIAVSTGAPHVYLAAGFTFALKVLAIPVILFRVLQGVRVRREIEPVVPTRVALCLAVAATLVAYRATGTLALRGAVASQQALPVAVTLVLLGLGIMIGRKKALSQVIGLITMENGVYLAALDATLGLPLAVELGVFFDLLVGVLLLGMFVYRINQTFDTINTDRLKSLRW
jgi:hydrogenase-4 membrane subunit HyfE